jgi:hypothetical protein
MDGNLDGLLDSLGKNLGDETLLKRPRVPKADKKTFDESVPRVIDDELSKLGYGDVQRLSILGDAGRENNWNRNIIFGGHPDPKNNAFNRGYFSWQGERQRKLDAELKAQGVYGKKNDDELRGMARFMDKELKTDYPQIYNKLKNAKTTYEASEALREYIKYVPDAPYNTYDSEFRVKNNREWAERAKKLGLGKGYSDLTGLLNTLDNELGQVQPSGDLSGLMSALDANLGTVPPTENQPVPANVPVTAQSIRAQKEQELAQTDSPQRAAQLKLELQDLPVGAVASPVTPQNVSAETITGDLQPNPLEMLPEAQPTPASELNVSNVKELDLDSETDEQYKKYLEVTPQNPVSKQDFVKALSIANAAQPPQIAVNNQPQATGNQQITTNRPQVADTNIAPLTESQGAESSGEAKKQADFHPLAFEVKVGEQDAPTDKLLETITSQMNAAGYDVARADVESAYSRAANNFNIREAYQKSGGTWTHQIDGNFIYDVLKEKENNKLKKQSARQDVLDRLSRGETIDWQQEAAKGIYEKDFAPDPTEDSVSPLVVAKEEGANFKKKYAETVSSIEKSSDYKMRLNADLYADEYLNRTSNSDFYEELGLRKGLFDYLYDQQKAKGEVYTLGTDKDGYPIITGAQKERIEKQFKDIIKQYGSVKNYVAEQKRINQEYAMRPLAPAIEFAKPWIRRAAKLPALVMDSAALINDINLPGLVGDILTGGEYSKQIDTLRQSAQKWRESVDNSFLKQNPDLKDDWVVNELSDALSQIAEQYILAAPTGGASLLIPLGEAATSAYNEADKLKANKATKIGAAIIGGLFAVPDIVLKAKYLRLLSSAEKPTFISNLAGSVYTRLLKSKGEQEAQELTKNFVTSFVKNSAKNFGAEFTEEYVEDLANKAFASVTYKPQTLKEVVVPKWDDIKGYLAAGASGVGGAGVETALENAQPTDYNLNNSEQPIAEQVQKIGGGEKEQKTDIPTAQKQVDSMVGHTVQTPRGQGVVQKGINEKTVSVQLEKGNIIPVRKNQITPLKSTETTVPITEAAASETNPTETTNKQNAEVSPDIQINKQEEVKESPTEPFNPLAEKLQKALEQPVNKRPELVRDEDIRARIKADEFFGGDEKPFAENEIANSAVQPVAEEKQTVANTKDSALAEEFTEANKTRVARNAFQNKYFTKETKRISNINIFEQKFGEEKASVKFAEAANGDLYAFPKGKGEYDVTPSFDMFLSDDFTDFGGGEMFLYQGAEIKTGKKQGADITVWDVPDKHNYKLIKPAKVKIENGSVVVIEKGVLKVGSGSNLADVSKPPISENKEISSETEKDTSVKSQAQRTEVKEQNSPSKNNTEASAPKTLAEQDRTFKAKQFIKIESERAAKEADKAKLIKQTFDEKGARRVYTVDNKPVRYQPKVIDAADLLTSADENYPQEFQPKDIKTSASKEQIDDITRALNTERLDDAISAAEGRPLVVPVKVGGKTKYAVISGNHRSEAIKTAYQYETGYAQDYKDFTQSKESNSFERPVYVGILDTSIDIKDFAQKANKPDIAEYTATEKALADADVLDAGTMKKFVPSEDGKIHSAANREFINKFFEKLSTAESRALRMSDGSLSEKGVERVRNALLAKTFGKSENLLKRMLESPDNDIKRITNTLLKTVGKFADLKQKIADKVRFDGLDISDDIAVAVNKYGELKTSDTDIFTYVSQRNMFGEELSPFQKRLLSFFDEYKGSQKAMSEIMADYLDLAEQFGNPQQKSIIGEFSDINAPSFFKAAVEEYEQRKHRTKQNDLFDTNSRRENESTTGSESASLFAPEASETKREIEFKKIGTQTLDKPLQKIADSKTRTDTLYQDKLKSLANKGDLIKEVESSVKGDELKVSLEAGEIIRSVNAFINNKSLKNAPAIDGMFLKPNEIQAIANGLDAIAEQAEAKGIDRAPLDTLVNNLLNAAGENGTVIINVFDDAVKHERFHQESFLSAAENERLGNRIENINEFAETNKDVIDKAYSHFFKKNGYNLKSDRATIIEEMATYIGTGDYKKLGISEREASAYLYQWFKAYKAKNGADSLNNFERLFGEFEQTQKAIERAKNEREKEENTETESGRIQRGGQVEPIGRGQNETVSTDVQSESEETRRTEERETAEITGETVSQVKTKNRQFAESLANSFYNIGAVEYEPQTEQGWLKQSQKDIASLGVENAIEKYDSLDSKTSEGYKTALGVAIASELYANGSREQFTDFGRKLTTDIGNIAQELRASQLLSRLSPEHASIIANTKKEKSRGESLTDEEAETVHALAMELKTVSDDLDSATAIIADTRRRITEYDSIVSDLNKLLAGEQAKSKNLSKDISKVKRQATYYKNIIENGRNPRSRPKVEIAQLKKEVAENKKDYSAILESAFGDKPLLMVAGKKGVSRLDDAVKRLDNLEIARQMEESGKDAKTIWMATGWERNKTGDGKWKTEIGDKTELSTSGKIFAENAGIETPFKFDNIRWRKLANGNYYVSVRKENATSTNDFYKIKDANLYDIAEVSGDIADAIRAKEGKDDLDFDDNWKEVTSKVIERKGEIKNNAQKLSEVLNDADELFKAYPALEEAIVLFDKSLGFGNKGQLTKTSLGEFAIIINPSLKTEEIRSVIHHEIQHGVQEIEGFAKGGSPEQFKDINTKDQLLEQITDYQDKVWASFPDKLQSLGRVVNRGDDTDGAAMRQIQKNPSYKLLWADYFNARSQYLEIKDTPADKFNIVTAYEQYRKLAGEVEARNVQTRLNMSDMERAEKTFAETEDISRESQIYLQNSIGTTEDRILQKIADELPDTSPLKDTRVLDVLVNLSAVKLDAELSKGLTIAEFDKYLDGLTGSRLIQSEKDRIHALAWEKIIHGGKPLSAESKALLKNRAEHGKRAAIILNAEARERAELNKQNVKDKEAFHYDKYARAMVDTAKSINASPESVFVAFGVREFGDERVIRREFKEAFPDGDFNKAFIEATKLKELTRESIVKAKIKALAEKNNITDEQVEQLEQERRQLSIHQRKAKRNLEMLFEDLTLSRPRRALKFVGKIYNIPRSFGFSGDAGFLGRQGGKAALMHSGAWAQAAKGAYPALFDKNKLESRLHDLYESEMRKLSEARGAKYKNIGEKAYSYEDWSNSLFEEGFDRTKGNKLTRGAKTVANTITFLPRRSNMAHGAFLDTIRLKIFEEMHNKLKDMHERGKITAEQMKASEEFFAQKYAPVVTGQGYGGKFDNVLDFLAAVPFAAPRLRLSHFQFLYYMNPARAAFLPAGARKIVYQKQVRFYAPVLSFLAMGMMAGLIGDDEEDSGFLKIKGDKLAEWTGWNGFKDMRFDLSGGAKEAWRTAMLGAEKIIYSTVAKNPDKLKSVNKELWQMYLTRPFYKNGKYEGEGMGSFWRYGMHPMASVGLSWWNETDAIGKPYSELQVLRDFALPLPVRQVGEAANYQTEKKDQKGFDKGTRLFFTTLFELSGVGVNSFPKKENKGKGIVERLTAPNAPVSKKRR